MKIDKIDREHSSLPDKKLAFQTNPPLTDEVWEQFEKLGLAEYWGKEGDLLIWKGGSDLSQQFTDETEQRLTLAENELKNKQTAASNRHQQWLNEVSKQIGRQIG